MKISSSKRLKATFLTVVFLLNTVVGFACSVGWDMGLNKDYHSKSSSENVTKAHSHPPGTKKHSHEHTATESAKDDHKHDDKKEKGGCCKDEVAKFVAVDKQLNKAISIKAPDLFSTTYFPTFNLADVEVANSHTPNKRFFVRCHHPPIPDIRIAVQSFQI